MIRYLLPALLAIACLLVASPARAEPKPADEADAETPEFFGATIGEFFYRDVRPVEGTKLRLSFQLALSVAPESSRQTERVIKQKRHRVRGAVLTAIRLCRIRDFREPGLETLRQRIAAQVHRAVPDLPRGKLLISEFAYFSE
ncbi:MAG: hypothetical protein AAFV43_09880 [Planctomycetota bacterium]